MIDLPGADLLFAENSRGPAREAGQTAWRANADPFAVEDQNRSTTERAASGVPGRAALASGSASEGGPAEIQYGHHLLWLQALGTKLPPNMDEGLNAIVEPSSRSGVSPVAPLLEEQARPGRWSLDIWGFWREGPDKSPISQGRVPTYGASQVGAKLEWRAAPSSSRDPRLFARAYRALVSKGESEFAVGASARPAGSVPVRISAEARVTDSQFGVRVRPAITAVTELPVQKLPAGFRLEAYGGAGYVGGTGATAFVDGQASVTRELASFDGPSNNRARFSVGAGAWGGAQEDASRIDVGPTVRLDITIGEVPARLSVDWRERVGGDAAPGSGAAATLSTRF
ncbi:hypothetical protein [Erythrobacter sp. THAF29]|uniref:hypothetical protein n=1 Tax=Erythrobacter sp. THAF29 TaxID=2587851 RepID=UPI00126876B6|nr:hypothetical protein [Erythrobacter sp. THAF29]